MRTRTLVLLGGVGLVLCAIGTALVLTSDHLENKAAFLALALTVGEFCGLSCVAMLGVMILRLDLYTGRTGHHMAHAV